MRKAVVIFFLVVLVTAALLLGLHRLETRTEIKGPVSAEAVSRPLYFEPNLGQSQPGVKFLSRGGGFGVFLEEDGMRVVLRTARGAEAFNMKFEGALKPELQGLERLPGVSNYYVGGRAERLEKVPNYARVIYRQVYPGIDLVFYGKDNSFEYDFIVAPGADPAQIRLSFEGVKPRRGGQGGIVLGGAAARVAFKAPYIYQLSDGARKEVQGGFALDEGGVSFVVAKYDTTKPLVIDPELVFSTFMGGGADDQGHDIALDQSGNILVVGRTFSADFPTAGSARTWAGGSDAFVSKFSPEGGSLLYSTFIGGTLDDGAAAITVNSAGDAFVAGFTGSPDFPTLQPLPVGATWKGGSDGFVLKLNSAGQLVYSTFFGGPLEDSVNDIQVDSSGNIYIAGGTRSVSGFPVQAPFISFSGGSDAFVAKIGSTGQTLLYSVFLGGGVDDAATALSVDSSGNAYFAGWTDSTNFFLKNPLFLFQGGTDAFVAKLDPSGGLLFSTLFGGADDDVANAIALDPAGNAVVAGSTVSVSGFPVLAPVQLFAGLEDAFVTIFSSGGTGILFSTLLGGASFDSALDVQAGADGTIHLTGLTSSVDFPVRDQIQGDLAGDDIFLTRISPLASQINFSTYLGGGSTDVGTGLAVNPAGESVLTGFTTSSDFIPVLPFFTYRGGTDAVVVKVSATTNQPPAQPVLVAPENGVTTALRNVGFIWEESADPDGDAVDYRLFVCENEDFVDCEPSQVDVSASAQGLTVFASFFVATGLVFAGAGGGRRRKYVFGSLAVLSVFLLLSCGGGNGGDEELAPPPVGEGQVGKTLALQRNTTYFWKVVAFDTEGGATESQQRTFTTP